MTEEERKAQQNIVRVGVNLGVILDVGLFPGQHAKGIEECKDLVKLVVSQAQAKLTSLTPAPDLVPPPPPAA